jgi:GT2 family glycosyltransferase
LASFARDAALRESAEIVYVLDSPEQRAEVEHLLRGMAALHGGPGVTLVVMPENRGYASACNAGAAASGAPVIGFLNSDVMPAAPGWLAPLLARLVRERRLVAVGPKLLYEDGAVQHAGLMFRRGPDGQWFNDHYFKGFPRHHAEACIARRVPGVTGAALFVRRTAFDAASAFSTDYIIGDFEDSDLCLALRANGGEIAYEPAAELFHFERQSISAHTGHARSLASACNRLLQHQRWNTEIARLMTRHPGAAG